jgi:hypothetical protein
MSHFNVDYFDDVAYTEQGKPIKILGSISDYISDLLNKNGDKLFELTNKQDYFYAVDVTINPKEKKIIFKPKYWNLEYNNSKFEFVWKKDFLGTAIEILYNIFESDQTIDRIIVDWRASQEYLQINEIILDKDTHETSLNLRNEASFKMLIRQMITKILNNDFWDDNDGSEGVLIFKRYGSGILNIDIYNKTLEIGQTIIIDEEYFKE